MNLHELICEYLDDTLDADRFGELQQQMRSDAAARQSLMRLAMMEQHLRARRWQGTGDMPPLLERGWRRFGWRRFAAAAVVMLAVGVGAVYLTTAARFHSVARITAIHNAVWDPAAAPLVAGAWLEPGVLRLRSGSVDLAFNSGATVHLEGPAQFTLRSPMRGILQHGKFTAHVPTQARGFTVETPGIEVVDLGTEYGLDVAPDGRSHLHVIRGLVEARLRDPRPSVPIQLTQGRTVVYDPHRDSILETAGAIDGATPANRPVVFAAAVGSVRYMPNRHRTMVRMTDISTVRYGFPAEWTAGHGSEVRGLILFPLTNQRDALAAAARITLELHFSGRSGGANSGSGEPPYFRVVHLTTPDSRTPENILASDFEAAAEPITDAIAPDTVSVTQPLRLDVTAAVKRDLAAGRPYTLLRIEAADTGADDDSSLYRAMDFVGQSRPEYRPQLKLDSPNHAS